MPLVEVSRLVKHFVRNAGFLRKGTLVKAVDDVSFAIEAGETFGLVGESGSGKTTTGRCVLRLVEPTSGSVRFRGEDVLGFSRRRMREARRQMQIVFQDPYSSLNPRMRARQIVEEPLIIHGLGDARRPARARRGAVPARRPRRRAPVALPARVQRRPAPAHRPGTGARVEPVVSRAGRARVGARRLGAGAGRQPARGPAAAVPADLSLHRPRSAPGGAHLRAGGGDVSGKDRRDGADGGALRRAATSLHTRAAVGDSRCPIPTHRDSGSSSMRRSSIATPRCGKSQPDISRRSRIVDV